MDRRPRVNQGETDMAELKEIAEALVAHCRNRTEAEGLATLYAPDAVSVEPVAMDGGPREFAGLDAIRGKHEWWENAMEVHEATVEGPFLHGDDRFAVIFGIDATDRQSGRRHAMREVGVYTVAGGRIVREEFYYTI